MIRIRPILAARGPRSNRSQTRGKSTRSPTKHNRAAKVWMTLHMNLSRIRDARNSSRGTRSNRSARGQRSNRSLKQGIRKILVPPTRIPTNFLETRFEASLKISSTHSTIAQQSSKLPERTLRRFARSITEERSSKSISSVPPKM